MGSSRFRLSSKPALMAAVAGVAGVCFVAFGESPASSPAPAAGAAATTTTTAAAAPSAPAASPAGSAASPSSPTTSTATTAPATPPAAPTHAVKSGKLSFLVQGDGVFVAHEPFELRLKLEAHAGPLVINSVAPNRAGVKKGDTLLELDPVIINREVAAADNDLVATKATLARVEADARLGEQGDALAMRIQQQETKNAEAAVKWWERVDGPQMLTAAEQQVKMLRASVEDQEDELDQLRKMYKAEDLTSMTADIVIKRALRQLDVSKVNMKMVEERAEKVEAHSFPVSKQSTLDALEQSRQKLETLKVSQAHAAVLRKTALTSARLAAAAAEKRLADLKKDQATFAVKAPADGVVLYGYSSGGTWQGGDPKAMRVGERLTSGQTVLTLFTPGDLKVELTVPESQSAWIRPGVKAKVTPVAFPELSYDGTCAAPNAKAGAAGLTFATTAELRGVDPRIVPGMKASVRIDGGEAEGVLLVPVSAVSAGKVWVRGKDGKEEAKDVTTGRSDGKMIEVKQGLGEGEQVLTEAKKS